jgi:phosphoribosyl 1,2-cyclic phosphodiesterase/DNA-binding response OmpR family regulator
MRVRFWGTRGSVPKPGPTTVRYGGNTSCVEVVASDGTRLVLDCGTGAHGLGRALLALPDQPLRGHILIGHTHWDHIQGFPFFGPLFEQGHEWDVYAPQGLGQHLEKTLAGQMQYTYFPVSLKQLGATIRYHDLIEGTFQAGGVRVTTRYLKHPAITLGYRLEADGGTLVYATDHEPHSAEEAAGLDLERIAEGAEPSHQEDRRHVEFLSGADVLIHDAQYTAAEYPRKIGWGHSTVEYVVDMALTARVGKLYLFHHDPLRTDEQLDALVQGCRERVTRSRLPLEVDAAAEGHTFEVGRDLETQRRRSAPRPVLGTHHALVSKSIVLALNDAREEAAVKEALGSEGFDLVRPEPGASLLDQVAALRPALLLMDVRFRDARGDALSACAAIRASADPLLRDLPVVMVRPSTAEGDTVLHHDGVTDYLTSPFTTAYVRARARAWLLRTQTRWLAAPPPPDEPQRVEAVRRLRIDGRRDERYDRITRLATQVLDVPMAGIGFLDDARQWFKSRVGFPMPEVPRDATLCAYTILEKQGGFCIADTFEDDRFGDMPLVTGAPHVRFYAGQTLTDANGLALGTLCVMDTRPRRLGQEELQSLRDLAAMAEELLRRDG